MNTIKGLLDSPWIKGGMFAGGLGLDYLNSRKRNETQAQTASDYIDMITKQSEEAYAQAIAQQKENWSTYNEAYPKAVEAATPDVAGYTRALQGIASEDATAARQRAGLQAATRGAGGGTYGAEANRIARESNEMIARNLLPMYQGYNIPLPQVPSTIMQNQANVPFEALLAQAGGGGTDWMSNALNLGGQYLMQDALLKKYLPKT